MKQQLTITFEIFVPSFSLTDNAFYCNKLNRQDLAEELIFFITTFNTNSQFCHKMKKYNFWLLKSVFPTLSDLLVTKRILFPRKKPFSSAKKTFFCAGGLIFAAALIFAGALKTTAALIFVGGLNICC